MPITAEECVAHLTGMLKARPADTHSDESLNWYAEVVGVVEAYDQILAMPLSLLLPQISKTARDIESSTFANSRQDACTEFQMRARSILQKIQLETNTFLTKPIEQGRVYDYFEEIRGIISGATKSILFVDPYLNPDFISRYMPIIPAGVTTRLLADVNQSKALAESLLLYNQQHGVKIEARVLPNKFLHDRHLIIDNRDIFHSGASFKDGAKNSPTSITQIVDAAADMINAVEKNWSVATPI